MGRHGGTGTNATIKDRMQRAKSDFDKNVLGLTNERAEEVMQDIVAVLKTGQTEEREYAASAAGSVMASQFGSAKNRELLYGQLLSSLSDLDGLVLLNISQSLIKFIRTPDQIIDLAKRALSISQEPDFLHRTAGVMERIVKSHQISDLEDPALVIGKRNYDMGRDHYEEPLVALLPDADIEHAHFSDRFMTVRRLQEAFRSDADSCTGRFYQALQRTLDAKAGPQ